MDKNERTLEDLKYWQKLPLDIKVMMSKQRIEEWLSYHRNSYISFSGGKDSTVLLHIVREVQPDIKGVYIDTGLEYPEIRNFVQSVENVEIIKPKMRFKDVVIKYGYPVFSKDIAQCIYRARAMKKIKDIDPSNPPKDINIQRNRLQGKDYINANTHRKIINGESHHIEGGEAVKSIYNKEKWLPACQELPFIIGSDCCDIMKKAPSHTYNRKNKSFPIIGTLAEESWLRTQAWVKNGCNAFEAKHPHSTPLSFWTEQDILQYIKDNNIKIASVYGDIMYEDTEGNTYDTPIIPEACKLCTSGANRTGCMFCLFGTHLEKKSRLVRLSKTHPQVYDYCMRGGGVDG